MKKEIGRFSWWLFLSLVGCSSVAMAGGLPWDRGLTAIGSTLTGSVAAGVAIIAIAAVGLGRAVNADLGGATQGIVSVVIIMAMVGAASLLVSNLGLAGGLVP